MVNFLSFLGWNPGTEQEIFNLDELVNAFELERVHKAGARFDPDKTKWYNHHYMQTQNNLALAEDFKTTKSELTDIDVNYIAMVIDLIKERATFVNDFWSLSHFFFIAPNTYDEKASKKALKDGTQELMTALASIVNTVDDYTVDNLQTRIKGWITTNEIGFGKVMMPLRLALVGALQGPDVFDIMYMIGKAETVNRIERLMSSM